MKEFQEKDIWMGILLLTAIIIAVGSFMFFRVKRTMSELAERSPNADVMGRWFGEKWGRIIPFFLFLSFIVLGWFLVKLYV